MKKIVLSISVIVVFVLYAIFHNNDSSALPVSVNKNSASAGSSSNVASGTSSTQTVGTYKDGTYTGSAADAFYGTIQVKAVIQSGKITDVQFLQSPNDRDESIQINQQAMPVLKQEAIQAQNANVTIVSGATDSSRAFTESLASALSQAK